MHASHSRTSRGSPVELKTEMTDGFWEERMRIVAQRLIPYQWEALNDRIPDAEPSHAIQNFRIAAGEVDGSFEGTIWQDSDVAKWLEAASLSLMYHESSETRAAVAEAVRLIAKSQAPDGYINSYFLVQEPDKRWKDLAWGHELYCAGHLIEAACAHHRATGSTDLLDVARRYADYIDRCFGPEDRKMHACCGHPEIELSLFRLAEVCGDERYSRLASYFVDVRGTDPDQFVEKKPLGFEIPTTKWFLPDYFLAHTPVRDQHTTTGHAVRAMYLYCAMADQYLASGDAALLHALRDVWNDTVGRKMYVTGGLGSSAHAERFTVAYDLPGDTAYAETCASIGLVLWASRMLKIEPRSEYADVLERALYNGALSGVSLDGTRYFYVNPLEVSPEIATNRHDHEHVKVERVQWFGCSCCPPNIARLVASLPDYLYTANEAGIWVNLYASNRTSFKTSTFACELTVESEMPRSFGSRFTVEKTSASAFAISFRIPEWSRGFRLRLNGADCVHTVVNGYARVHRAWRAKDVLELNLEVRAQIIEARPEVRELSGKVSIRRGPFIYCFEQVDNGPALQNVAISSDARISETAPKVDSVPVPALQIQGIRTAHPDGGPLYRQAVSLPDQAVTLTAVPYFMWGNRSPGEEMRVWIARKQGQKAP